MEDNKPKIGITLGDIAGIGPEVAIKVLQNPIVEQICSPIIIGEYSTVKYYADLLLPNRHVQIIDTPEDVISD